MKNDNRCNITTVINYIIQLCNYFPWIIICYAHLHSNMNNHNLAHLPLLTNSIHGQTMVTRLLNLVATNTMHGLLTVNFSPHPKWQKIKLYQVNSKCLKLLVQFPEAYFLQASLKRLGNICMSVLVSMQTCTPHL